MPEGAATPRCPLRSRAENNALYDTYPTQGANMTKLLLFLGSLLNLVLDIIYKIFRSLVIGFLVMFAICVAFALILVWLT